MLVWMILFLIIARLIRPVFVESTDDKLDLLWYYLLCMNLTPIFGVMVYKYFELK